MVPGNLWHSCASDEIIALINSSTYSRSSPCSYDLYSPSIHLIVHGEIRSHLARAESSAHTTMEDNMHRSAPVLPFSTKSERNVSSFLSSKDKSKIRFWCKGNQNTDLNYRQFLKVVAATAAANTHPNNRCKEVVLTSLTGSHNHPSPWKASSLSEWVTFLSSGTGSWEWGNSGQTELVWKTKICMFL